MAKHVALSEPERTALKKTEREQLLIQHYGQLGPVQKNALSILGVRIWLLQGPLLIKEGVLVADLFFKISSELIKGSVSDVFPLYNALHKRLFYDMDMENQNKFSFFESLESIEAKRKADIVRYEYRFSLAAHMDQPIL